MPNNTYTWKSSFKGWENGLAFQQPGVLKQYGVVLPEWNPCDTMTVILIGRSLVSNLGIGFI